MKSHPLILLLFIFALQTVFAAEDIPLEAGFANPPESAKPRTWWHWISGNVSEEGITADLEAMKRIGLGGAQIFTVDQSAVKGPVKFMSKEWRGLVHHALEVAGRLGLEISMEGCDGWSESGGPWVAPAQSMQKLVWTETEVNGGQIIMMESLSKPLGFHDYYEDIASFAYPTPAGSGLPAPVAVTASAPGFEGGRLIDHDLSTAAELKSGKSGEAEWIQVEYGSPVSAQSLRYTTKSRPRKGWELQSSNDGKAYKKICGMSMDDMITFPTETAKFFRIYNGKPAVGDAPLVVAEISFGRGLIDRYAQRVGMSVDRKINIFTPSPAEEVPPIDGKKVIELTGREKWEAPAGKWTVVRLGHTSTGMTTHPSTQAGLECDKMSRAAVEAHFQEMFGPVMEDSPEAVGKTLNYVLLDSWEAECEDWTPLMAAEFNKRRGYDLQAWLPALTGRVVGSREETERFLWDYRRTLADLVADEHYGVIQELAHQHGMGLAAEATGIGMPTVADQLQCKGRTDIPMGEFWTIGSGRDDFADAREAACAAHIYGQNIAATESFTSSAKPASWKNDPYSLKALGDMEFCNGVNRFLFHRYAHQPWLDRVPGMSMGPWGINFERTNTWWEQGSAWISYLTRCEYLLQRGRFVADLCYFYGEGAPVCVSRDGLRPAPPQGYDFDVCNAEILLQRMTVEEGRLALPSGMRYRVLVLPENDRMTTPMIQKIHDLVQSGATVYGPKPIKSPSLSGYPHADEVVAGVANEVWGDCDGKQVTQHAYGRGRVVWGEPLEKVLETAQDFACSEPQMLYIHRTEKDAEIYFVSNQRAESLAATCAFRVEGKTPELWMPDTGLRTSPALHKTQGGQTTLPIHFDPLGSVFVIFRTPVDAATEVVAATRNGQPLLVSGSGSTTSFPTVEDGAARLIAFEPGSYGITLGSGEARKVEVENLPEAMVIGGTWRLEFPPKLGAPESASFERLMSWTESPDDGVRYFSGTAIYKKDFELADGFAVEGVRTYLDLGEIKNLAEVILNGQPLGILWKPPFRAEITHAARAGTNHLEVKVTNLWPNRLIGDEKLPANKRITWASVSQYKADSPLLPSGLLGPVTIRAARQVKFGK